MKHKKMSAKPLDRYGGKLRPFLLLSPEEDRLVAHCAIDAGVTKSEWLKRAALYCVRHQIDLSDNSK